MSSILRALFIAGTATGVAAAVLKTMQKQGGTAPPPRLPRAPKGDATVDADRLSPAERALLLQELDAQL